MITIVTVEIVCAVFLCILLVGQTMEGSTSKSSRMLNLCILLVLFSLVVDAMAYSFVDATTPFAFRYIVCVLAYKGIRYYDYILMDIQMPVMNGYEATKAIRALPSGASIPIIALSANAFEEDKQRSLQGGMNAHIAKPIDVKELFDAMQGLAKTM